jgi:hypothetical protein
MALSVEVLQAIDALFTNVGPQTGALASLRQQFPLLSWTTCDASDVNETPFRSYARFDIHLLNSTDHCAQITLDPAHATGIILARR